MTAHAYPQPLVVAARNAHIRWDVPASVTLAQWADESGYGVHMPADSNNPFGIKAAKGQPCVRCTTSEVVAGKAVHIQADFLKYPSIDAAIDAHAKLLFEDHRYAPAMDALPNLALFISHMASVYATDPLYASKLLEIITRDNLTQYDNV